MPLHLVLLSIAALLSVPSLLVAFRRQARGSLTVDTEMTLGATVAIAALGMSLSRGELTTLLAAAFGPVLAGLVPKPWQRRVLLALSAMAMLLYLHLAAGRA